MTNPTEKIIRDYLERMVQIRSTGGATSETSYYSALENLLNEIGKTLKPAVVCNGQLRNQGAGHADFGLYNKNQCSKGLPQLANFLPEEEGAQLCFQFEQELVRLKAA